MDVNSLGNPKFKHYSNEILLNAFQRGPYELKAAMADLSLAEMRAVPIPSKWSIAEIVIHLCDAEIVGACRFRQIYCGHTGFLPTYQESTWARVMNYNSQSRETIYQYIDLFENLRKTTMVLLSGAKGLDWAKQCAHPEMGNITLRGALELYADHSERHLDQIMERRLSLGKSVNYSSVLSDRLY